MAVRFLDEAPTQTQPRQSRGGVRFLDEAQQTQQQASKPQQQGNTIADNLRNIPIIGPLLSGGTQAIAAPGIQRQLSQAAETRQGVDEAAIRKLREAKAAGDDDKVQRLLAVINKFSDQPATLEDIVGELPSDREVAGSAAETALTVGSLGLPGATSLAGKLAQGAGIGATTGAAGAFTEGGNIAQGALFGGAFGSAIPLGGAALNKLRRTFGEMGNAIALKGLRPSPTQITKFSDKTGKDLADFVVENRLFERGTDQVDAIIDDVQRAFDDIARKSGRKIPVDKLQSAFDKRIKQLQKSVNVRDVAKSKELQGFKKQLIENIRKVNDTVDVGDVSAAKTKITSGVNSSEFLVPPAEAGAQRETGSLLRRQVEEAAEGLTSETGETVGELGIRLRDLNQFRDIAKKQENLGRGSLPVGLIQLLGLIGGGTTGLVGERGGAKSAATNAALGLLLASVANNPRVIAGATKGLLAAGRGASQPQQLSGIEKLLSALTGSSVGRGQ